MYSIFQVRRVVRKYNWNQGNHFASNHAHSKRIKKVKIIPNQNKDTKEESHLEDVSEEAASQRLLNPFSLFNLVRFPNTQCTTDRGMLKSFYKSNNF